jgi:hypothetical protein
MKYNPAVRKNILLQEMTAYTNQENVAFTEALAAVEQLDDNTNDELAQALVAFMRSLVHDNIARSNQVRNALNTFFDETGEFDEDTYLLFKPYEVVEPKEESVVETQEHVVEEKEAPVVEEDEPVADEEPVSESEEQVQDEVVESEEEVVPTDVSEEDAEVLATLPEDAEVLATLPEDDEAETEEVDVIGDVFGTSEEELKTRDRAEALSAEIELPDSL